MSNNLRETGTWLIIALLLVGLTIWAYHPGLSGGFLFDDYANLPPLGDTGPINTLAAFWRYITSGTADPTGRPLALLTFLIDAHDWPADPWPFKRTNLVLHVVNAVLLGVLIWKLGRRDIDARAKRHAIATATLAAAFWALHPLFVSTTLYIVQREAMLPATTVLLGLLTWLRGRRLIAEGRTVAGAWVMIGGIGIFSLLGMLAKANGALLPVFVLVVEATHLRVRAPLDARRAIPYRRCVAIVAIAPSVAIGVALTWLGVTAARTLTIADRPWTIAQRLISEPRVLVDYLRLLWLPRPFTSGVFNDQFGASISLLQPMSTLVCLLVVALLIGGAVLARRRFPILACAVLFYFAGQLVESTTIPLELYFEHRNYLPAMLMFWPLAAGLVALGSRVIEQRGHRAAIPAIMFTVALLAGETWMTRANAVVWGDNDHQAQVWARFNPESARAQANAAQADLALGQVDAAIQRLTPLAAARPDELQVALNLAGAWCARGVLPPDVARSMERAIATSRNSGSLLSGWFARAMDSARNHQCQGMDLPFLDALAAQGLGNPQLPYGRLQDLLHARGAIALEQGNAEQALMYFNQALAKDPRLDLALQQAATLGSAGYAAFGLRHLDYFDQQPRQAARKAWDMQRIHAWVLQRQGFWENEMTRLRRTLQDDAKVPRTPRDGTT